MLRPALAALACAAVASALRVRALPPALHGAHAPRAVAASSVRFYGIENPGRVDGVVDGLPDALVAAPSAASLARAARLVDDVHDAGYVAEVKRRCALLAADAASEASSFDEGSVTAAFELSPAQRGRAKPLALAGYMAALVFGSNWAMSTATAGEASLPMYAAVQAWVALIPMAWWALQKTDEREAVGASGVKQFT